MSSTLIKNPAVLETIKKYLTIREKEKNQFEPEKLSEVVLAPNETRTIKVLTMPQAGSFYPVHFVIQSNDIQYKYMVSGKNNLNHIRDLNHD